MAPYVCSRDGRSLSIYGSECQNAREIATCKQNVEQKEDFMHSNFQIDISLPWIDVAFI